jgi:hypothetical protein
VILQCACCGTFNFPSRTPSLPVHVQKRKFFSSLRLSITFPHSTIPSKTVDAIKHPPSHGSLALLRRYLSDELSLLFADWCGLASLVAATRIHPLGAFPDSATVAWFPRLWACGTWPDSLVTRVVITKRGIALRAEGWGATSDGTTLLRIDSAKSRSGSWNGHFPCPRTVGDDQAFSPGTVPRPARLGLINVLAASTIAMIFSTV